MKKLKMSVTVLAFALAMGTVFAKEVHVKKVTNSQWHKYTGSTSSPTITTVMLSDDDAATTCPNGGNKKCLVRLDGAGQETSDILFRPAQ